MQVKVLLAPVLPSQRPEVLLYFLGRRLLYSIEAVRPLRRAEQEIKA